MAYKTVEDATFRNSPALPACAMIAVESGDPGKGPSVILLKAKAGCVVPWHWHTANERLVIVSGTAKGEMKDGMPLMLKAGDYVVLPARGIHRLTVLTDIELFNMPDAAFDIHYVDPAGKEIPVEAALKAVN
jgi:quercetin dioxygenase-like cupin family protein